MWFRPLVSVIMPTYNAARFLNEALAALAAQTYRNFEVICVDDGSTDGSGAMLDAAAEADSRFRVFHKKNAGAGAARTFGLKHVRGEYLMWCDADDFLEKDAIREMVRAVKGADMAVCRSRFIDTDDLSKIRREVEGDEYYNNLFSGLVPVTDDVFVRTNKILWNKIFRTGIIRRNDISMPKLKVSEDTAFVGQYMMCVRNIRFIDSVLYNYRRHNDGLMGRRYNMKIGNFDNDMKAFDFLRRFAKKRGEARFTALMDAREIYDKHSVLNWIQKLLTRKYKRLIDEGKKQPPPSKLKKQPPLKKRRKTSR